MRDRTVHAEGKGWEIVRYDRAGKWYVEWTREGPPIVAWPDHIGVSIRSRSKRIPITIGQAVTLAVGLEATVHYGRLGGSSFDRQYDRKASQY